MKNSGGKDLISIASLVRGLSVLIIVVILSIVNQDFLSITNLMNILRQATILVVLALGITYVLLTAGIDLSVGGVMALVGCMTAQLLVQNVPIPIAIGIGLLIGAIMGAANGFLVGVIGIPAFVATYGMMWIAEGLAHILMQGRIIFGMPRAFLWFGAGYIWKIPVPVFLALILVLIFHYLLQNTVFGRNIFALGSNRATAYYSGIRTKRLLVQAYAISGITAAIAGMIMTARINAAEAGMGGPFSMQSIAAVVIGGTSLLGGEGGVIGSVVGALILTLIVNGLNLLGVSSLAHALITGSVIIIAVCLDIFLKRKTN
jgi:ribose transport system permease protein